MVWGHSRCGFAGRETRDQDIDYGAKKSTAAALATLDAIAWGDIVHLTIGNLDV
jgi:hypothetical protein